MEELKNQNKENQLKWIAIPNDYKSMKDEIKDDVFKNIYSKFSFKYYKFNESQNNKKYDENFILFVFNYLIKYKFIVFDLIDEKNNQNSNSNFKFTNPSKTNCVICVEDECLIIEEIEKSFLDDLLSKLHGEQISLINVSRTRNHKFTQTDMEAKEEIRSFCENFREIIKQNIFVSYTINSIIGYLIRRYYFQSNYFKNPNFFYFDKISLIEPETKKKILRLHLWQKQFKRDNRKN